MNKYEISLWEDYPDTTTSGVPFLNERKLCVIGSDSMHIAARAVEPKLINNINGTNTFSFKMYQTYTDELTGEKYTNPFLDLLINERKVKVLWKEKWYDLIIKDRQEDTSNKSIVYTCNDSYITELSRNGYNLEYSVDLQNNTGTAGELTNNVLKNSGWSYDEDGSTRIIQKTEEPVYEVITSQTFSATKQSPNGDIEVTIPANKLILIFYSSVVNIDSGKLQFLYASEGYATNENDMLVTNGDCYITDFTDFSINTATGISTRYRAERLVKTQISEYDELFDRYVNVYTDNQTNKKVYGYERTEFSDPLAVVNLIANPSKFTSLEGWIGSELTWGVYPKFTSSTDISTYDAKSYLKVNPGYIYNSAISSNKQYLVPSQGDIKNGNTGGFHINDKYIFRVKAKTNSNNMPGTYIHNNNITPFIGKFNDEYQPIGNSYFSIGTRTTNGDWTEFVLTCITACPASDLNEIGFFINVTAVRWIEEIEFFKYEVGVTSYESSASEQRINPGEVSLQSIAKTVYRYYNADHNGITDVEQLDFLYEGTSDQSNRFIPVTNNYEKIATIQAKGSNRFNILQSIAESFKCWVKFTINHNEDGSIIKDEDGLPEKYVTLVEYIGSDLGWCFEYGIDLKNMQRKIVSNELSTKILVLPNQNEFGKNGFCTIARSNLNYSKENFILDFGYYTSQGLLDQNMVNRDLYSTSQNYLGYYYNLHKWNKEYDEITELLVQKKTELTKQQSQLTVLEAQQKAAQEQLENCKSDIMTLACVNTWADAQAYIQSHADHTKVQSLMNTIAQVTNIISKNEDLINDLRGSVNKLDIYIADKTGRQKLLINSIEELHTNFFKKYARYIQEGTWQDESYIDDDKYYLDALDVAYTSSRPQLQYTINVMRLQSLDDFSSKEFDVGDICYIVDREFFGYSADKITPYKLKIIISEITSFFDEPWKDIIKVQNYKTQFDDLFQRITATTQSLQYAQGGYEKAAGAINPDKTLSFNLLQDTFDYNENWVLNANNQQVIWDSTGITVSDSGNAALKVRIIAGGIFISNDGGNTWKNAIRGDGISTDILTAGRINTSEIYVYDGGHPSFRWDSAGIDAYYYDNVTGAVTFNKYVRFDKFGIYGYNGNSDFVPSTEDAIWNPNSGVKFGLTWRGFFLRGENGGSSLEISDDGDGIVFKMLNSIGNNSLEISTSEDIVLKTGDVKRVQIGRLNPSNTNTEYGIWVRDGNGDNIFNVSSSGVNSVGGWTLTKDSFYHTDSSNNTIGLYSSGKNATVQGNQADYYILAGSKFGVTIDGNIYASGGKIGGWTINDSTLTGGNVTINSSGTLNCTVNGDKKWELTNSGDLFAKTGEIAGWLFNADGIYNKSTGTYLNCGWDATYNVNKYTIKTNSISASGGNIGGVGISGGGLSFPSAGYITIGGKMATLAYFAGITGISYTFTQSSANRTVSFSNMGAAYCNFTTNQTAYVTDGDGNTMYVRGYLWANNYNIAASVSVPTYSLSGSFTYVEAECLRTAVTGAQTVNWTSSSSGGPI